MRRLKYVIISISSIVILSACAVLPKTLNHESTIITANCKWIGKMGQKTLGVGAALPVLKNIDTGQRYKVQYKKKPYTFFYSVPKGNYKIEEIILEAGQIQAKMKTADLTNSFEIDAPGVYYLGGIDIIDYQIRFEYKVHDSIEQQADMDKIRKILSEGTSLTDSVDIKLIEGIFIKEKWE